MCGGSISPGSGVLSVPDATWAQSSLAVPAQVPGSPVGRGKTDFRQVPEKEAHGSSQGSPEKQNR